MNVQAGSQLLQETHAALELLFLLPGDESVLRQRLPGFPIACCTGDPEDCLQVAQAAGSLLAIGLQAVRRAVIAQVALLLLFLLRFEEGVRVEDSGQFRREILEQPGVSSEQAGFEQRGLNSQITACCLRTLVDRAHARRDLQSDVVEDGDDRLELRCQCLVRRAGQQQHQVHVRCRIEFAAPITADSDQRQ